MRPKAGLAKPHEIFREITSTQYSNLPDDPKEALIQTLYAAYTWVRGGVKAKKG